MKFPDLLATKAGRLTAFFALYMTEGIPLGFTATVIATQMRREGLGPAEITAFVGSLYTPWAFKWIAGPFVDVFSSDRWGRRRAWIIGTQVLMVLALLAALPVNFSTQLTLFTNIILVHNFLCATQDVAIDALACSVLKEEERGVANGLMFGGANVGQWVGGAGVLYLLDHTGLPTTFYFVSAMILSVTVFIAVPLKEPKGPPRAADAGSRWVAVAKELRAFIAETWRSVVLNRNGLIGLLFALLPAGAYALGLGLQSNLSVEFGMSNTHIGHLSSATTISAAVGCVCGGWLSDRLGRRRMLALFVISMSLPTLWLAWTMQHQHWVMPIDVTKPDHPVPSDLLLYTYWGAAILYAMCNGLMYGARSALFMDITNPVVAATQFTAYMACLNLVIRYSSEWQGTAVERWGYPITLTLDATVGIIGLLLLPTLTLTRRRAAAPASS